MSNQNHDILILPHPRGSSPVKHCASRSRLAAAVAEWLLRLRTLHKSESEQLAALRESGTPDADRERENDDLAERIASTEAFLERQLAPRPGPQNRPTHSLRHYPRGAVTYAAPLETARLNGLLPRKPDD